MNAALPTLEADQRDDAVTMPERRRPSTAEETALAERLVERDPRALSEIYDRFGPVCFGFLCAALRDQQAAEDVQQQVFLEVWQRAANYDAERGALLTWILTIARSRAIDQLRRRVAEPVGTLEDRGGTVESEIDALVERWRVAGLLRRLHPEEERLLRLRFYEDLTQREIAERTGIPLGTVKMRMVSGLERLRSLMEER